MWQLCRKVSYLNQNEDGGYTKFQGVQTIDDVELQSHTDQGEEEAKVEEAG